MESLILQLLLIILLGCSYGGGSSTKPSSYYYDQCAPSTCGNSTLRWPFGENPLCRSAYTTVSCNNGKVVITYDQRPQTRYELLEAFTDAVYARKAIRLVDTSVFGCGEIPEFLSNENEKWLNFGSFYISPAYSMGTFFNCSQEPQEDMLNGMKSSPCLECGDTTNLCYYYDGFQGQIADCRPNRLFMPRQVINNLSRVVDLRRVLQEGFVVEWNGACEESCVAGGGRCGYMDENRTKGSELCFCSSGVHQYNCTDGAILYGGLHHGFYGLKKTIVGVAIGLFLVLVCICCFVIRRHSRRRNETASNVQDEQALRRYLDSRTPPVSIESFLQNYTSGMPTRFSYKQLRKFTNNFSHKLGQGGFGSVFKATLSNGCVVAVKLLDETEQSERQFLNEVQTVGRIHHEHLVRLLGYCFEQSKRALVYEFMEKGSLEKYIHRRNRDPPELLSWSHLYEIAVGTAKGIAYLHEECRHRILHCDIKPHNILLDAKFRPKVSDFGLAQIMNRELSHVSLARAGGTPGYSAPEMWLNRYGPVTEKADVYSFGMVLLEMVGGRRNFEEDMSRSNEAYFPEWVFSHLVRETGGESFEQLLESSGDEEERVLRRMALVGLWCIQYVPSRRPAMRKVIEMLEGNGIIDVPPPFGPMESHASPSRAFVCGGPVLHQEEDTSALYMITDQAREVRLPNSAESTD